MPSYSKFWPLKWQDVTPIEQYHAKHKCRMMRHTLTGCRGWQGLGGYLKESTAGAASTCTQSVPREGSGSHSMAFCFLTPLSKAEPMFKRQGTNQHIKYEFLKKMSLSMDSTQLAEPASSVPQAFGQPSFGPLPEKQWKCVSTLAFREQQWVHGLGKHQQLLRAAESSCAALSQCSPHTAHLCHPTQHSCLPLFHSAFTDTRVAGTLFSTGQCFSHSSQSLPVFLLIWHCKWF